MRIRARILVVWLAAAFVVAGSAIGFANSGSNHGSEVSAAAKAADKDGGKGDEVSTVAKQNEENAPAQSSSDNERKLNHGFYVSQAAQCEDVDDPATTESPDFTAPADCQDGGKAHGEYVSSVAKSSAGKPDKAHGPNSE